MAVRILNKGARVRFAKTSTDFEKSFTDFVKSFTDFVKSLFAKSGGVCKVVVCEHVLSLQNQCMDFAKSIFFKKAWIL